MILSSTALAGEPPKPKGTIMNAAKNDSIQHNPVVTTFPIIIRELKDNSKVVFILNSLSMETETIQMWPYGSNSTETFTVSLEAYRSSMAVSEADEAAIMYSFAKMNNILFGLVLRKRLFKVNPLHFSQKKPATDTLRRAGDVKSEPEAPFDKEAFIEKIIVAVTTALREAIKA